MNRLEAALRQAAVDLNRYGQLWALVGGFAVSARAQPRFTRDVDIAVAVADDRRAEEIVRSLLGDGYALLGTVEHDNGRLAGVRLKRHIDGVDIVVDLLFASSGIEGEVAQAAEILEIVPGLQLPVARTGHLIALKLLARGVTPAGPGRPAGTSRRRHARRSRGRQCRRSADHGTWLQQGSRPRLIARGPRRPGPTVAEMVMVMVISGVWRRRSGRAAASSEP